MEDPNDHTTGRYASVFRKDFDAAAPLKLDCPLKKIGSRFVDPSLSKNDTYRLKTQYLSYPELDLVLSIKLCEEQSQIFSQQEGIFKEKIFNIAKDIMQNTSLIKSVSTAFFPQNLTTEIERQAITPNFDFRTIDFNPPSLVSQRSKHIT